MIAPKPEGSRIEALVFCLGFYNSGFRAHSFFLSRVPEIVV